MRKIAFCLIIAFNCLVTESVSQKSEDPLSRVVTLDAASRTCSQFAMELSTVAGFKIAVPVGSEQRRFIVAAYDRPVREVLDTVGRLHDWRWERIDSSRIRFLRGVPLRSTRVNDVAECASRLIPPEVRWMAGMPWPKPVVRGTIREYKDAKTGLIRMRTTEFENRLDYFDNLLRENIRELGLQILGRKVVKFKDLPYAQKRLISHKIILSQLRQLHLGNITGDALPLLYDHTRVRIRLRNGDTLRFEEPDQVIGNTSIKRGMGMSLRGYVPWLPATTTDPTQ